jgi:two-component system, NarL family, sensor kinase
MSVEKINLAIFIILITVTILILILLVIGLITAYQKRQLLHFDQVNNLKLDHERNMLTAQLEIQEDTFRSISREIHDNISLSLTLAKLNLNLFDWDDQEKAKTQIRNSVELLGNSIENLGDISRSLNSDFLISQGLVRAIEDELERIRQVNIFKINLNISDHLIRLNTDKELLVFRIFQEAFNNIIKHANANIVDLTIYSTANIFFIEVADNGKGFDQVNEIEVKRSGLKNMQIRTKMLNGCMHINSKKGVGTILTFKIPVD